MERLAELIGKLKEQFEQKADHEELLVTTQMIQVELLRSLKAPEKPAGSSKVAVVMPAARNQTIQSPIYTAAEVRKEVPIKKEEVVARKEEVIAPKEEIIAPREEVIIPKEHQRYQPATPVATATPAEVLEHIEEQVEAMEPPPPLQPAHGWHFDPVKEIPTLAHQQTFRELNEVIGAKDASLNDKLKEEVVEVAHRLTDSPIRDLKRAIGINDRYTFINELFRGDEAMYERSLKTINAFRIYAEAEYWIERELKVKLGWEESRPATRHFYQLVKRRFS